MKNILAASLLLALAACGDSGPDRGDPPGPATFAIGGTVTGLTGAGLVLANGTETVNVAAGATQFTLPAHASGSAYAVVVQTQPAGQTCAVSAGSGTVGGLAVSDVKVDCHGHTLYVAGDHTNVVDVLPLDAAGMPVVASITQVTADQSPRRLVMTPDSRHLYVLADGADAIDLYDIATDGALTRHAVPISVATGDNPIGLGVTPDGRFLYAATAHTGSIDMFAIGNDGVPSPLSPSALTLDSAASIAISPDGSHLYAGSYSAGAAMYAIGSDGQLAPLATPTTATGGLPYDVVLTPDGKHAYATNANGTIREFAVQADGTLARIGDLSANINVPQDITISADGKFAYVPDWGANVVLQYAVGADGLLTPLATPSVAAGDGPVSVALSPDGKKAYVANLRENTVAVFDVNADGTLNAASRTAIPVEEPYHLLFR
jgi:6-phosphogluconolactonase (cycloisomerase 2 family)